MSLPTNEHQRSPSPADQTFTLDDKQIPHSTMSDEEKASEPEITTSTSPSKDSSHDEAPLDPAPDGGLRAWLVAAGGATIFFCCLGFSNSFGAFEEFYLTHQLSHESPGRVAWIGSISVFLQFAAGAIGGPLFDRFGAWVCLSSSQ